MCFCRTYTSCLLSPLSLSPSPNAVLRLRFNHFATECSWDHMYIYDGDSIYAPLIAVFRWAPHTLNRGALWGWGGAGLCGNDLHVGSLWHSFKGSNTFVLMQLNGSMWPNNGPIITITPQHNHRKNRHTAVIHLFTLPFIFLRLCHMFMFSGRCKTMWAGLTKIH